MAVKATMAFVDTTGQASRVIAYTADQAAANTLSAAIAAASNAGQRNVDGITVTIHTGAATAADYFDVEDKASLVFKAADGSTHKYQIPAPVTAMFDPADQETVLHSDPTGVVAAAAGANVICASKFWLPGYAAGTFFKQVLCLTGNVGGGFDASKTVTGLWLSTAAITQLDLVVSSGNWTSDSVLYVWGRM